MTTSSTKASCSDPECKDGFIVVHDAYAADPLVGERRPCDRCSGQSFIFATSQVAIAN